MSERRGDAAIFVDDTMRMTRAPVQIRPGLDDIGRYHRWIGGAPFTPNDGSGAFLLIARRRETVHSSVFDVLTLHGDGRRELRTVRSDARSESYPMSRVLSQLGDETQPVYDWEYWTFLPAVLFLLPVTGPWIGALVGAVALCYQLVRYRRGAFLR